MTIKNRGGVFGRNPTFNNVDVEGTLSIAGAAVPAPANTLTTSDIGSTVQGYDADTAKLDVVQTFTANQSVSGNFGVGTSSLPYRLMVSNDGAEGLEIGPGFLSNRNLFQNYNRSNSTYVGSWNYASEYVFHIGGSEKMRLNTSGNLAMASGNGIDFSATSGTGTSELFDDYEEGTWTPAITFGGGNTGVTYSVQSGNYTKIGNLVTITCYLVLTSKGTSTGNVKITGLPFSNVNFPSGVSLGRIDNISFTGRIGGNMTSNATTIDINETTDAGVISGVDDTNFSNSSSLYFSTSYHTS